MGETGSTGLSTFDPAGRGSRTAARIPTQTVLELIDWTALPADAKAVALRIGPMLCDGFKTSEIALSFGKSEDWVSARVKILRDAIANQLGARLDSMAPDLRAQVEKLLAAR
jgi:hypothetical protein